MITAKQLDAYRDAVLHLESHKLLPAALLPECRALWQRGGSDRALAEQTVRRWTHE